MPAKLGKCFRGLEEAEKEQEEEDRKEEGLPSRCAVISPQGVRIFFRGLRSIGCHGSKKTVMKFYAGSEDIGWVKITDMAFQLSMKEPGCLSQCQVAKAKRNILTDAADMTLSHNYQLVIKRLFAFAAFWLML